MKVIEGSSLDQMHVWCYTALAGRRDMGPEEAFMIQSSWQKTSTEYRRKVIEGLDQCEREGVSVVHSIMCHGNDDVEDYLLDTLELTTFPVFLKMTITSTEKGDRVGLVDLDGKMLDELPPTTNKTTKKINAKAMQILFEQDVGMLFIGGDRSSVGKTSCCLGLLAYLVDLCGVSAEDIGYIKPVTQCEAEQPIVSYCASKGVECVGIGPVVFYKGFTRAFLAGETPPSEALVADAARAVREMKKRRKLVIVDGVGYPAVGSICGISNAHTAAALDAPVLLIGKSGVGDAVDSHNLNSTFFEHHGVRVLGTVFNKLALEGYYDINNCADAIDKYFRQYRRGQRVYGYLPTMDLAAPAAAKGKGSSKKKSSSGGDGGGNDASDGSGGGGVSSVLAAAFASRVDVLQLIRDVRTHTCATHSGSDAFEYGGALLRHTSRAAPIDLTMMMDVDAAPAPQQEQQQQQQSSRKRKVNAVAGGMGMPPSPHHIVIKREKGAETPSSSSSSSSSRSRAQIEAEARALGASGG